MSDIPMNWRKELVSRGIDPEKIGTIQEVLADKECATWTETKLTHHRMLMGCRLHVALSSVIRERPDEVEVICSLIDPRGNKLIQFPAARLTGIMCWEVGNLAIELSV